MLSLSHQSHLQEAYHVTNFIRTQCHPQLACLRDSNSYSEEAVDKQSWFAYCDDVASGAQTDLAAVAAMAVTARRFVVVIEGNRLLLFAFNENHSDSYEGWSRPEVILLRRGQKFYALESSVRTRDRFGDYLDKDPMVRYYFFIILMSFFIAV
jgi:hypothetical protein